MRAADGAGVFDDDRGSLLAVELTDLPFTVRRVFVVSGRAGGADRGDHVVPCAETIVLLSGAACFWTTSAGTDDVSDARLDRRGQRLDLDEGDHVRYRLLDEHSSILVLAEQPYEHGAEERP
ncbi:MAG: WxcM-like domain-containing protein [Propionibacteriales bacterium]|nr:WxcM-like domain-containing protein [Propionibacteriales bacterium]